MKQVNVEDSVGKPLAHDIIRYGPGVKTVLFKRGHVVQAGDVEKLKDAGNYSVYIAEEAEGEVHEDDAASRMARALAGENLSYSKPDKGRVAMLAEAPGLLRVKLDVVRQVNPVDDFIFVTRADELGVRKRQIVGVVKIVPLVVDEGQMKHVEEILTENEPVLRVITPHIKKVAVAVTGTEVYERRTEDAFLPALSKKLGEYGLTIQESAVLPDDEREIKDKILEFKRNGHELILVTGGMAVDAGDVTPAAIRDTGAEIVSRGAPTFPGAMIMLAYLGETPIIGVPACVIPDKRTSLDRILPRVLAGEKMTKESIAELGVDGLLQG